MKSRKLLCGLSAVAIMSSLTACPGDDCYWKDSDCKTWPGASYRFLGEPCYGDSFYGDGYSIDSNKKVRKMEVAPNYDRGYCYEELVCVWDYENSGAYCVNSCSSNSDCSAGYECVEDSRSNAKDGDDLYGGHCAKKSSIEDYCGNGVVAAGEACDDGNSESGDGCSKNCQIEVGWDCVTNSKGISVCSAKECHSGEDCYGDSNSDGSSDALTDILPDDGQSDNTPGDDGASDADADTGSNIG